MENADYEASVTRYYQTMSNKRLINAWQQWLYKITGIGEMGRQICKINVLASVNEAKRRGLL